jgi:hypothetical protein
LSIGPKWDQTKGMGLTTRLRTRFYLPNTDHKFSAIVGRFDVDEFLAGVDNARPALIRSLGAENDWFVGLGYDPIIRDRQRLSLGAGFRGGLAFDPYLRARYLVQKSLNEKSQLRWQSVVFWRNSDGLGVSQRPDYSICIPKTEPTQQRPGRWEKPARAYRWWIMVYVVSIEPVCCEIGFSSRAGSAHTGLANISCRSAKHNGLWVCSSRFCSVSLSCNAAGKRRYTLFEKEMLPYIHPVLG